jgi:hypothetical protein
MARTVRPTGVAARWRMFTSMPTLTKPSGRYEAVAEPDAISISASFEILLLQAAICDTASNAVCVKGQP